MSWENLLLADLAGEMDAAQRKEQLAEAAELVEAEAATRTLADRWRAKVGHRVAITVVGGEEIAGRVVEGNAHWILLADAERRVVVPAHAVVLVRGLNRSAATPGTVEQRFSFAAVLRRIARSGATVRIEDAAGARTGRIVRLGADHLDLRTDPDGGVVAVVLAAIRAVRTS